MTYEFLSSLYDDLLLIIKGLVVKRYDLARANETAETAAAFELYNACLNGSRYFYNFSMFDVDILERYFSPRDVYDYMLDPNKIPEEYRDVIVEEQAQRVIDTYDEGNEYYRLLAGLPRKDDKNWIYITDQPDIPDDKPIHELSNREIARLEHKGILASLKVTYPDAKYLDFLGINRIDIITARLAKPFEILRIGVPNNDKVIDLFNREYYGARQYVMATIYNRALITTVDLYDPVMGMLMLTLAARNTLVPDENTYMSFEEILDAILESYGMLSYFKQFPFVYKRRLVLALDKILSIKGTDGVIVDVCQLFQGTNFTANRYYLMKTYNKYPDGTPMLTGDDVNDQTISFLRTTIRNRDVDGTALDYDMVTENDYLWQLTEDELNSLHSEDFNLWMSKYIGVQAAYDISTLTFEVCYFLNMLLESPNNIEKIRIVNQYATGGGSDLFTTIVAVLAIMAKRSGYDGNIIYEPDKIAEILRFDYGEIEEELSKIIHSYEDLIDIDDGTHFITGYDTIALAELDPISTKFNTVETYIKNRELYNAILHEMHYTTDIRHYEALSKAKECMYISAMEEKDFMKSDGTPAATYLDMLMDIDPKMADTIDNWDAVENEKDLNDMLLYILNKLEDLFRTDELKYLFLNTSNIFVSVISKFLRIAINVFKASTVQLESINVFFNVGDHDPIRVFDQLKMHRYINLDDTVYVFDELAFHKHLNLDDYIRILDKSVSNETTVLIEEE